MSAFGSDRALQTSLVRELPATSELCPSSTNTPVAPSAIARRIPGIKAPGSTRLLLGMARAPVSRRSRPCQFIDLQHSKDAACSGPLQRLRRSPMALSIPNDAREALSQAKRVLSIVMRLKTSKILFNEPVDPVTLGLDDYLDKVANPMDFGTVMSRLQQGEKAGWKKCYYSSPEEVLRDVRLVFDNCFAYNDGPGDELTRELCSEVKDNFEKRWGEASLPLQPAQKSSQAPPVPAQIEPIEWMSENDVPVELSYAQGAACSYTSVYRSISMKCNFLASLQLRPGYLAVGGPFESLARAVAVSDNAEGIVAHRRFEWSL